MRRKIRTNIYVNLVKSKILTILKCVMNAMCRWSRRRWFVWNFTYSHYSSATHTPFSSNADRTFDFVMFFQLVVLVFDGTPIIILPTVYLGHSLFIKIGNQQWIRMKIPASMEFSMQIINRNHLQISADNATQVAWRETNDFSILNIQWAALITYIYVFKSSWCLIFLCHFLIDVVTCWFILIE